MPDYSITPGNIRIAAGTPTNKLKCGEAGITPMMALYESAGAVFKALATDPATSNVRWLALNYGDLDDHVVLIGASAALINIGATVAQGDEVVLSAANPGGLAPRADLGTGNQLTVIGYGAAGGLFRVENSYKNIVIP